MWMSYISMFWEIGTGFFFYSVELLERLLIIYGPPKTGTFIKFVYTTNEFEDVGYLCCACARKLVHSI